MSDTKDVTPETIEQTERQQELDTLAREVLTLSRDTLLVNLRFMDMALSRLTFRPGEGGLSTDGRYIYYDARHVLRTYQKDDRNSVRDYLHMVLHCVFRHHLVSTLVDRPLWNLSCDIAVESSITALNPLFAAAERQTKQLPVIAALKAQVKQLTAEKLYRYFLDQDLSEEELEALNSLFYADCHEGWYPKEEPYIYDVVSKNSNPNGDSSQKDKKEPEEPEPEEERGNQGPRNKNNPGDSDNPDADVTEDSPTQEQSGADGGETDSDQDEEEEENTPSWQAPVSDEDGIDFWKDVAERMQTDLETFSQEYGDTAGALFQNLRAVNREKYDYAGFLRKFSVLGEAVTVNDDEFDYIFYSYGMQLFGKMPLIEPLEYKEMKKIREFVIAIDTSGSTSGELVQKFIQKTYNILCQEESFFKKINLHIIQCDAEIQEDVKITSQEEFDRYLQTMQLHGFGGTDFRPVFSYVEELRQAREFTNLKGLIYFTDGFGTFPERKPDYNTAFVFVNGDDDEMPDLPPWAIKLVLEEEEIEAL